MEKLLENKAVMVDQSTSLNMKEKIRRIAITVGDNGYIVGDNPVSLPKEDK